MAEKNLSALGRRTHHELGQDYLKTLKDALFYISMLDYLLYFAKGALAHNGVYNLHIYISLKVYVHNMRVIIFMEGFNLSGHIAQNLVTFL